MSAAATTSSATARSGVLSEALALWHGNTFGDCADLPDVQPMSVRLDELRLAAIEDLAESLLETGRGEAVIVLLEENRVVLRYRDRPVTILMRAFASRAGRRSPPGV